MPTMTQEEFQVHVVAELSKLNTHMLWLVGNGQPGKIKEIENALKAAEDSILITNSFAKGIAATLTVLWVVAGALFTYWHYHPLYAQTLQQLSNQSH